MTELQWPVLASFITIDDAKIRDAVDECAFCADGYPIDPKLRK